MGNRSPLRKKPDYQQLTLSTDIYRFISDQLDCWSDYRQRIEQLNHMESRRLILDGRPFILLHNPARAISSGAKVTPQAIAARPCFLCENARPAQQLQLHVGQHYTLLVNPFPVFPHHLTIVERSHTPQLIRGRMSHLSSLTGMLSGFTIFYNGPRCGASAPDHMHFQAVPSRFLPLWSWPENHSHSLPSFICLTAPTAHEAAEAAEAALTGLDVPTAHDEPPVNILARRNDNGTTTIVIIPRKAHRPDNFGTGSDNIFISPASIDMAGAIVCPRRREFDTLTPDTLRIILSQVSFR